GARAVHRVRRDARVARPPHPAVLRHPPAPRADPRRQRGHLLPARVEPLDARGAELPLPALHVPHEDGPPRGGTAGAGRGGPRPGARLGPRGAAAPGAAAGVAARAAPPPGPPGPPDAFPFLLLPPRRGDGQPPLRLPLLARPRRLPRLGARAGGDVPRLPVA